VNGAIERWSFGGDGGGLWSRLGDDPGVTSLEEFVAR
jgi:hypothetical protein